MKVDVDIRGDAQVLKKLEEYAIKHPEAMGAALYEEGLLIQKLSVERTPVDTGGLRQSAYTAPPEDSNEGPVVKVSYGKDYAIYVHERTELHHAVGQAKFLESAANERMSGWASRVAKRVEKHVEKGTAFAVLPKSEE